MAKLVTCPTCKKELSNNANRCPHCGEAISMTSSLSYISIFFGLAIVVFMVFVAFDRGGIGWLKSNPVTGLIFFGLAAFLIVAPFFKKQATKPKE